MTGLLYLEHRQPPVVLEDAHIDANGDQVIARYDGQPAEVLRPEASAGVLLGTGCDISTPPACSPEKSTQGRTRFIERLLETQGDNPLHVQYPPAHHKFG
mgnify:CR=1 FL=1